MKPTISRIVSGVALTLSTLCLTVTSALAFDSPTYGPPVDQFCAGYNGTTPFATQSCLLCHTSIFGGSRNALGQLWAQTHAPSPAMCPVVNTAPVANAGANQTVSPGSLVTLDGTGSSDVDGNTLTYQWSFTSRPTGSGATLSNPTTAHPTFTADRAGQYVAQLIVTDNGTPPLSSAPATVTISTANTAPVGNAGPNQTVPVGTTVTLNGSGSTDADGNSLTYQWSFASVPTGSAATLVGPTTVHPTFTVDRSGSYTVRLIVNDGTVNSTPATVTIATSNTAPVANAGADQSVTVGSTVTLSGGGSTDVDGNPLSYDWSFVTVPAGSTATFSNPTAATPTFVAERAGQYVVQLIVNDGTINSVPDNVIITASAGGPVENTPPVANAGPDQTVSIGATVNLNGSGSSDADRNTLRYSWTLTNRPTGSNATLSNAATLTPSFVADMAGQYIVQLIVNDGMADSAPDTVTITTVGGNSAPVANAGPDKKVAVGTIVTLDGSGSTDPDGTPVTYQWTLIKTPHSSTAQISNPGAVQPTIKLDKPGEYIAQLIVSDGLLSSTPDTVVIKTTTMPRPSGVYIQRAKWIPNAAKLMIVGRASKDAQVAIRDAASGRTLTTVTANEAGRFRAFFTPPFVPCAVVANVNGVISQKTPVVGAASNCGVNGGPPVLPTEQEREASEESESVTR
jgi:hypothetical protein